MKGGARALTAMRDEWLAALAVFPFTLFTLAWLVWWLARGRELQKARRQAHHYKPNAG